MRRPASGCGYILAKPWSFVKSQSRCDVSQLLVRRFRLKVRMLPALRWCREGPVNGLGDHRGVGRRLQAADADATMTRPAHGPLLREKHRSGPLLAKEMYLPNVLKPCSIVFLMRSRVAVFLFCSQDSIAI